LLLVLVAIPFFPDAQVRARLFDTALIVMIYAILALGLNIVVGWVGLLELGYVGFVLIGVYTTAILYARPFWQGLPFGFLAVLLLAGLHAALWGVLRGWPTLRLRGDYYAIVTFAFAEIVFTFVRNEVWLTGGPQGFRDHPPPRLPWDGSIPRAVENGVLKVDGAGFYGMVLVLMLLTLGVMIRLSRSRVGRAWYAIRADETSAQTCGIPLRGWKMLAFALSAFFGGVGGGLMAWKDRTASPNTYDFWLSVVVLCCVVIGGMGSIRGVLVGTLFLAGLGEGLRDLLPKLGIDPNARFLFYGAVMISVMIFRTQGLLPARPARESFGKEGIRGLIAQGSRLFRLSKGG
jgi:branched-chain amino acid transport system permease protein